MRSNNATLRCYAEKQGSIFVAVCIDLSLAAQADTMEEAISKLDKQIHGYVHDVFSGADQEHIRDLFPRMAPLNLRIRYQYIRALCKLSRTFDGPVRALFRKSKATAFNEFWPAMLQAR